MHCEKNTIFPEHPVPYLKNHLGNRLVADLTSRGVEVGGSSSGNSQQSSGQEDLEKVDFLLNSVSKTSIHR